MLCKVRSVSSVLVTLCLGRSLHDNRARLTKQSNCETLNGKMPPKKKKGKGKKKKKKDGNA